MRFLPALRNLKYAAFFAWSGIALASPHLTEQFDRNRFLIGAAMEFLVPDELPGFESPQLILGPRLSVPIGSDHAEFQAGYSSSGGSAVIPKAFYLVDFHYRKNLEMPYLTGFLSAGMHFTYYRAGDDRTEEKFGPTLGMGLIFPMDKDFSMGVEMRNYFLDKSMWAFGGNFEFVL